MKHGHNPKGNPSPEYRSWQAMIKRCENPNVDSYPKYGGAGIKVCERWRNDFLAFLADMGLKPSPRHSIDRHPDGKGNYEPGNCRWATPRQQAANRNTTAKLTAFGQTRPVTEWARGLGIPAGTIKTRMRRGWSPEDCLSRPGR